MNAGPVAQEDLAPMQSQPNRPARRGACRQSLPSSAAPTGDAFDDGRETAALEMVAGIMAALDGLHPDDTRARQWYRRALGYARTIAGLPPLAGEGF